MVSIDIEPRFSGKTSIYNKQKKLEKASQGCSSITSFFKPKQPMNEPAQTEVESEIEEITETQFFAPAAKGKCLFDFLTYLLTNAL
jgi:hypothetical protein